jgi:hypothetical protein
MKKCTKCGIEKPQSEFYKDKSRPSGKRSSCKNCDKLKSHLWRKADPHKTRECWRASKLKKKYNITNQQYEDMKIEQNDCCAICNVVLGFGHLSAIDHCHKTGKVRGLLCRNCNLLLGNAKDNIDILKSAQIYLKKYNQKTQ